MPQHKPVSIIGCGWLGLALARSLVAANYPVHGTRTALADARKLSQDGIHGHQLIITPNSTLECDTTETLLKSETLIITLPFKRSFTDPHVYTRNMQQLIDTYCQINAGPKHIVFTSSTSIYSMENKTVDERTLIVPQSERQQALYNTEQALLLHPDVTATIVRCGGLFGPNRHIGNFTKNRVVQSPDAQVNLVHQDDVIAIISAIIQLERTNDVFNAVSHHQPTKRDLYSQIATKRGEPLPLFSDDSSTPWKRVDGSKAARKFGFTYRTCL